MIILALTIGTVNTTLIHGLELITILESMPLHQLKKYVYLPLLEMKESI